MIVNQPHDKQLGIQLIEALESQKYNCLTIMVAYAKLSGVYRVLPYIEKFCKRGGIFRIVVGIDQKNTTYEALEQLSLVADSLTIYHSESFSQTFHIKCFWLKGESECWYSIGSNNLTAGGLFSNYELCTVNSLSGDFATNTNEELEKIYITYSDADSVCTQTVNDTVLSELLENNYLVGESQQRRAIIDAVKKHNNESTRKRLFGNELFPAPQLPIQYREKKAGRKGKAVIAETSKVIKQISPSSLSKYENNYLIRLIPKAGNRSKQVHFTVDLLKRYFCLSPGDEILLQEVFPSGNIGEIEQRQIVFSQRNRNVKIELAGASILDTNYPEDTQKRPVLVVKKVNDNLFVYMLLMEGDNGYEMLNDRLMSSSPKGNALPYEIIDESEMISMWEDCPIH